jgi:hypothetical protein
MMLRTLTLSFTLIAAPLYAQEPQSEDPCPALGDLARAIMENRQVGTPINRMMEIANGQELVIAITLEAYQQPQYSTPANQSRAVTEFSNDMMTACYLSM